MKNGAKKIILYFYLIGLCQCADAYLFAGQSELPALDNNRSTIERGKNSVNGCNKKIKKDKNLRLLCLGAGFFCLVGGGIGVYEAAKKRDGKITITPSTQTTSTSSTKTDSQTIPVSPTTPSTGVIPPIIPNVSVIIPLSTPPSESDMKAVFDVKKAPRSITFVRHNLAGSFKEFEEKITVKYGMKFSEKQIKKNYNGVEYTYSSASGAGIGTDVAMFIMCPDMSGRMSEHLDLILEAFINLPENAGKTIVLVTLLYTVGTRDLLNITCNKLTNYNIVQFKFAGNNDFTADVSNVEQFQKLEALFHKSA